MSERDKTAARLDALVDPGPEPGGTIDRAPPAWTNRLLLTDRATQAWRGWGFYPVPGIGTGLAGTPVKFIIIDDYGGADTWEAGGRGSEK